MDYYKFDKQAEPRNPYKGLQAFSTTDAEDFFGREADIQKLLEKLELTFAEEKKGSQNTRLLALIGPSGSGKSSLIMAGLLPQLQSGRILNSQEWIYLEPTFPGSHPLESLALTLSPKFPLRSMRAIHEDLISGPRSLHLLLSVASPPRTKVVLVVDGFEELFTQTTTEEERGRFIELLCTAVTEPRGSLLVLITLRDNFYDRLIAYPNLSYLIAANYVPLLPMNLEQLRTVIEGPAQLPDVRLSFEKDLVYELLFATRGQHGALPILQFTLDLLFSMRNGHDLTLNAYESFGGVAGVFASFTESIYFALPSEEHRELARMLFLRLIIPPTIIDQNIALRRASLSEFMLPNLRRTALLQEVIDALVGSRLLVAKVAAENTTIEISSDTLLHGWTRLNTWIQESRNDMLLGETIRRDAILWAEKGKLKDWLYYGKRLQEAKAWAQRNIPNMLESDFIQSGLSNRTIFSVFQSKAPDSDANTLLKEKIAKGQFDVFLCHNSKDKTLVKEIAQKLKDEGILPWLDEWELPPGYPWQPQLEKQIQKVKSAAVFVGKDGIGPWQRQELDALLREFVKRQCPVIPVLLEYAPKQPHLPSFLESMTWIDFRKRDPDPLQQLIWGITGKRNDVNR